MLIIWLLFFYLPGSSNNFLLLPLENIKLKKMSS
jgi:hypothetical protein